MRKVIKKNSVQRTAQSTKRGVRATLAALPPGAYLVKGAKIQPIPVVDETALEMIRKIEKRVREFREHVGAESKADNIRYKHATELLNIVRMMRNAELDGWTDI